MANPVRYPLSGTSRHGPRTAVSVVLIATALGGCSINLGSLTPSSEPEEPTRFTSSINVASLSAAIKNSPNDPVAYNKRGSALAQAGKTDEALADFDKPIGLEPNYGAAYANRGLTYRQTGGLDLAMADFERAIALDANN